MKEMSNNTKNMINPQALHYLRTLFAKEDTLVKEARERSVNEDFPIGVPPEVGKTLHLLIALTNPQKIIEIGTHAGCSMIWMARALSKEAHLYTIERSPDRLPLAKKTLSEFDRQDQITLCEGFARDVLPTLEDKGPFDLIFIDADKPGYLNYLDWAEKNIRKGGLIIADDTFLFGAVYQKNLPSRVRPSTCHIMKTFNQRLANPEKYLSIMLPSEHGLLVAQKLF
tara:strand:+ start:881 stop:1558 length:678 start_codon:yes stop_codon:yes gene_type:complete